MSDSRNISESIKPDLSKLSDLVKENNIEAIKIIIAETKKSEGLPWGYRRYAECAVRDAIRLGHTEIIKLLLEAGVNSNAEVFDNGVLRSLISFAAEKGDLALVKLFVEKGAHVAKTRDFAGEKGDDSAIKIAVKSGHVEMTKYLLDQKGVSANNVISYGGWKKLTFLAEAALHDNHQMAELLVERDASIPNAIRLAEAKFEEESRYTKNDVLNELKKSYQKTIKNIMDYAVGVDFETENPSARRGNCDLSFLNALDVSGFNFIGVSVAGQPITRDMLLIRKIVGADKAIFTLADLKQVEDKHREVIKKRVEVFIQKRGQLVDSNGVVNLVPLWRAAEIGNVKAVAVRLQAGIDPNELRKENECDTVVPLVEGAKNGHIEVVKMLLAHPKIDVKTIKDAILAAQKNNHAAIVDLLFDTQDINQKDEKGDTRLYRAVRSGRVEEVHKLIKKGADVNLKGSESYPLHIAARKSYNIEGSIKSSPEHLRIIKVLLEAKADPNLVNYQYNALDDAASVGSFEAIKLLIPYQQKVMRTEKIGIFYDKVQKYPWYRDLMFNSYRYPDWLEILKLLKSEGADLNCKRDGDTLLSRVMRDFPCLSKVSSYIRDLKWGGYDVSQSAFNDQINKHKQFFCNHLKLLDFLLENGADPNVTENNDADTPLHELIKTVDLSHIENGYDEIIDRCVKKGFKIETPNKNGKTILHLAAAKGMDDVVQYLLKMGADPDAFDRNANAPRFHYGP